MSELKTNKISTNDQNNVAIDNALGLKSYDTAGRDALTSVAGDMIYTTETVTIDFIMVLLGATVGHTFLFKFIFSYSWWWQVVVVMATGGGGGAGGYRNSYASETSGGVVHTESSLTLKFHQ